MTQTHCYSNIITSGLSALIAPVPPNATVVFEVEVYSVSKGPRSMEAFKKIDADKDKSLTKDEVTVIYRLRLDFPRAETRKKDH